MYTARRGRLPDHEALAAFTRDTFDWGDYVADAFPEWLDDEAVEVIVVEHETDGPVAVATLKQPGPHQAWMAAARVHPDHRRKGLASLMNDTGVAWARARGDRVARLIIEDWNEAAQRQVEALGYRHTSQWWHVGRDGLGGDPNPTRNGGRRVPGPERLEPATAMGPADAWPVWERSGLIRAARGLIGVHWTWWRLTIDDLGRFAAEGTLWQAPSGWVVAEADRDADTLQVYWLCGGDDDLRRLTKACVDLAVDLGLDGIRLFGPAHDPLGEALAKLGLDDPGTLGIWEKPLLPVA
jgi:GNAT superfamily N-acetyltransferase